MITMVVDNSEDLGGGTLAELVLDLVLFVREARITGILVGYHMLLHGFYPNFQVFHNYLNCLPYL